MKVLAIEKEIEDANGEKFRPFLIEEAKKIWELMQNDIIREIYFSQKDHCAVIIMECENESLAKSILNTLPLVKEKAIEFDVRPLIPYDGFSRLFI